MEMQNTTERIRAFMRFAYSEYAWFEQITGINASKWRDLDRGKTKAATAEMIEAACKGWPEFAFWFVTGDSVRPRGHVSPMEYFDLTYGVISEIGVMPVRFERTSTGQLLPDRQIFPKLDKHSVEYEIKAVEIELFGTALVNQVDAKTLAPAYRKEFLEALKPGETFLMELKEVKEWVNRHPATPLEKA